MKKAEEDAQRKNEKLKAMAANKKMEAIQLVLDTIG